MLAVLPRLHVLRWIPRGSVGVEVGVWRGRFTKVLLKARPKRIYLVDSYEPSADETEAWTTASQAYNAMQDRLRSQIRRRRVIHIQDPYGDPSPSPEASQGFEDGSLDWVYIDGDHSYEVVAADLKAWWPKLRVGGHIIMDDWLLGGLAGVYRAGLEFVHDEPSAFLKSVVWTQARIEKRLTRDDK